MITINLFATDQFQNTPKLINWHGFAIKKQDGRLFLHDFLNYETRNQSTLKIITESIEEYRIHDFDWIIIHTGDRRPDTEESDIVVDLEGRKYFYFSYSTDKKNHLFTIPDFVFDHWRQTGLDDYEDTRNWLKRDDHSLPKTNMLGWRGANTNSSRNQLIAFNDKVNFDCEFIVWDRTNPERLIAKNFLSFTEQVESWRYFIDMEGVGYSGRLKLLLASPRLVFIQERTHEEFFFPLLKPWIHYVPLNNDLSNLMENLSIIKNNSELEEEIIFNQRIFSQFYLTRDFAKFQIAKSFALLK